MNMYVYCIHVYHCDTNNEFLKLPMIFLLLVACNRGIRENGICMDKRGKEQEGIECVVQIVGNTHIHVHTCTCTRTVYITSVMLSILDKQMQSQYLLLIVNNLYPVMCLQWSV